MPAMPRPSRKSEKIAYDILGIPPAMYDKKTPREREIDKVVYRDQVQRTK